MWHSMSPIRFHRRVWGWVSVRLFTPPTRWTTRCLISSCTLTLKYSLCRRTLRAPQRRQIPFDFIKCRNVSRRMSGSCSGKRRWDQVGRVHHYLRQCWYKLHQLCRASDETFSKCVRRVSSKNYVGLFVLLLCIRVVDPANYQQPGCRPICTHDSLTFKTQDSSVNVS